VASTASLPGLAGLAGLVVRTVRSLGVVTLIAVKHHLALATAAGATTVIASNVLLDGTARANVLHHLVTRPVNVAIQRRSTVHVTAAAAALVAATTVAAVSVLGATHLTTHLGQVGADAQGELQEAERLVFVAAVVKFKGVVVAELGAVVRAAATHVLDGLLHHVQALEDGELVDAVVHAVEVVGHPDEGAGDSRVVSVAVRAVLVRASHFS